MPRDERGVELDRQHLEVAIQLILQGDALTQLREAGEQTHVDELLLIDCLLQLADLQFLT